MQLTPSPVIVCRMRDWLVLMAHLIVTTIRTVTPGGARAVIAESLLLKHQLLILNRSRKKAPKLRAWDRILLGLGAMLVSPQRILKLAVAIRPSTLLRFHRALVRRKYPSRAEPLERLCPLTDPTVPIKAVGSSAISAQPDSEAG